MVGPSLFLMFASSANVFSLQVHPLAAISSGAMLLLIRFVNNKTPLQVDRPQRGKWNCGLGTVGKKHLGNLLLDMNVLIILLLS